MCALVTGVQTCALPIYVTGRGVDVVGRPDELDAVRTRPRPARQGQRTERKPLRVAATPAGDLARVVDVVRTLARAHVVVPQVRDPTAVVQGTSVSERLGLGCRQLINKKTYIIH